MPTYLHAATPVTMLTTATVPGFFDSALMTHIQTLMTNNPSWQTSGNLIPYDPTTGDPEFFTGGVGTLIPWAQFTCDMETSPLRTHANSDEFVWDPVAGMFQFWCPNQQAITLPEGTSWGYYYIWHTNPGGNFDALGAVQIFDTGFPCSDGGVSMGGPGGGPPGNPAMAQGGVDLLRHDPNGFYLAGSGFAVAQHEDWMFLETLSPPLGANPNLCITQPGSGIDMISYVNPAQQFDPIGNPTDQPFNLYRMRSYDLGETWQFWGPPSQEGGALLPGSPFLPNVKWARQLFIEGTQEYAILYNDTTGRDRYGYPDGSGVVQFQVWNAIGEPDSDGPFQVCPDLAANSPLSIIEVRHPTRHLRACWQDGSPADGSGFLRHFFSFDDGRTWKEIKTLGQVRGNCPALAYNERTGEYGIMYNSLTVNDPVRGWIGYLYIFRVYDALGNLIDEFPAGFDPKTTDPTGFQIDAHAILWVTDRTHHLHFAPPEAVHLLSFDDGRTWAPRNPY